MALLAYNEQSTVCAAKALLELRDAYEDTGKGRSTGVLGFLKRLSVDTGSRFWGFGAPPLAALPLPQAKLTLKVEAEGAQACARAGFDTINW